jgi:hypothetical protein
MIWAAKLVFIDTGVEALTTTHIRGDTLSWGFTASVKDDGVLVTDMTGWTIRSHARALVGSTVGSVIQEFTAAWVDATARTYTLSATAAQTAAWTPGVAVVDVEFTSPVGVVVSTPKAVFNIEGDVTI